MATLTLADRAHRTSVRSSLHRDGQSLTVQNSLDSLGNAWHYVNIPLHYLYIALLLLCFILSLGNRPAGYV